MASYSEKNTENSVKCVFDEGRKSKIKSSKKKVNISMQLHKTPGLNKTSRISLMSENMEFESEPSIDSLPSSNIVEPTIQAINNRAMTSMNT